MLDDTRRYDRQTITVFEREIQQTEKEEYGKTVFLFRIAKP